jgi:bifunctional DNase/RNase
MRDQSFYAQIELEKDGEAITVDARPSDAIALALRVGAPILVANDVLAANAIPINPAKEEEEAEKFREFLQNVKPGDFGKFSQD